MDIIITGTSKGIGKEMVAEALAQGHRVLAITTSSVEDCQGTLAFRMEAEGSIDSDALKEHLTQNNFSPVALIHNAGVMINKRFNEFQKEDFDRLFRVNVWNAFHLTQVVVPFMPFGSHIVLIGSMGGFQGSAKFQGLSLYSASKAALSTLGECLAEELSPNGISVNTLALGAVNTEMLKEAFPDYKAPVEPKQMAKFILRFALEAHPFINGKVVPLSISTP